MEIQYPKAIGGSMTGLGMAMLHTVPSKFAWIVGLGLVITGPIIHGFFGNKRPAVSRRRRKRKPANKQSIGFKPTP